MPNYYDDSRACAQEAIAHVGKKVVLALPLGLGKANRLANAFYDIAAADPSIHLAIYSALTLEVPRPAPGLERRFMQPVLDRLFDGYVQLNYAKARRDGTLPHNIEVHEFFMPTGSLLNVDYAQREYVAANYTHVTRLVLEAGANIIAQMIATRPGSSGMRLSLASNPDLALDVVPAMRASGRKVRVIGEANALMPFMPNDAEVPGEWFDSVFQGPPSTLFGLPTNAVTLRDHAIGLHASTLIRDGGTLQIGIGSLSDAVSHALLLRHHSNAAWRGVTAQLTSGAGPSPAAKALGGEGAFEKGLYGCSEMIGDGLLALLEQGILKREISDTADGRTKRRTVDGAFFLGSRSFYERLRALDETVRSKINMTAVSRVNALYGDEAVRRGQRVDARFLNTVMEATALGGAASDALTDGRVVSGVGGQYNFVAMAHELSGGRSILLVRAHKMRDGRLHSGIVWERPNETIPRHLKDIVVSEYGIADLRGQTEGDTVKRMLAIADSRFQGTLLEAAKRARKVEANYEIPQQYTRNTPERIATALGDARAKGLLPAFPFGSDLTETEITLAQALRQLRANTRTATGVVRLLRDAMRSGHPPAADPYLERLGLLHPNGLRERTMRLVVVAALRESGAI